MRSVAVVFPASMCAMIPMFRQRFRGTVRGTAYFPCGLPSAVITASSLMRQESFAPPLYCNPDSDGLPAIVREGLVGLGHAVHVFLLLHRCAATIGRIQQLIGELVDHALFATGAPVGDEPANRERSAPLGVHFDRHLVVCAANTTGLDF